MSVIFGIVLFVAMFFAIFWLGRWILGPIDRAAKARQAPARISIGDMLCLFVVVQLPLTFVSRLRDGEGTEVYFWMFTFLAWVVAPITWIACAFALSRAGITRAKHRFVFMGLVLPVVYYGLTPFIVLGLVGGLSLVFEEEPALLRHWEWAVGWLCLGVALLACGRFTNWLVGATNEIERDAPTLASERLHDAAAG